MYYIIGEIHGCLDKITTLFSIFKNNINDDDILIFLGDYIDRGKYSYEVIEFLISISGLYDNTVFLKGNHEDMFLKYIHGEDKYDMFLNNGGGMTISSYRRNLKSSIISQEHMDFFCDLKSYYEGDNFIAVHAGLNPKIDNITQQYEEDILWIRNEFYTSQKRWGKTIIFGHTPTIYLAGRSVDIYFDNKRNIIGVDTGAVYGGKLSCLRWPEIAVFQC